MTISKVIGKNVWEASTAEKAKNMRAVFIKNVFRGGLHPVNI